MILRKPRLCVSNPPDRRSGRARNAARGKRAGSCFVGDIAGAAGEAEHAVIAGDALARFQIGVDRASFWNAFAAEQFERVGSPDMDMSVRRLVPATVKSPAAATFRVVSDAGAAFSGSGRKQLEFSGAGASA